MVMDLPNLSLPEPVQLPPTQLTEPAQVLQERVVQKQDVRGGPIGVESRPLPPLPAITLLPPSASKEALPAIQLQTPAPSPALEAPRAPAGPRPTRLFPPLIQPALPAGPSLTSYSPQLPALPPTPSTFPQLPLPTQALPAAFPVLPNADRTALPQTPVVSAGGGLEALASTFGRIARDIEKLVSSREEKKQDYPTEPNLPRGYL